MKPNEFQKAALRKFGYHDREIAELTFEQAAKLIKQGDGQGTISDGATRAKNQRREGRA